VSLATTHVTTSYLHWTDTGPNRGLTGHLASSSVLDTISTNLTRCDIRRVTEHFQTRPRDLSETCEFCCHRRLPLASEHINTTWREVLLQVWHIQQYLQSLWC